MRSMIYGALLVLTISSTHAQTRVSIYDSDPSHLWNRLYSAMAVRTAEWVDPAEPYRYGFESQERLISVLDELLATRDEAKLSAPQRALLLNDVWTAFDMSARSGNPKLQLRLARALDRLRMTAAMRELLEDNYSAAVRSNAFAKDFDPAHPETAFLPPDLFDPGGPWVQVGEHTGRGLVAPEHVDGFSGRSAF